MILDNHHERYGLLLDKYEASKMTTHASLQVRQDFVFRVVHFYDRQVRGGKRSSPCLREKCCWWVHMQTCFGRYFTDGVVEIEVRF